MPISSRDFFSQMLQEEIPVFGAVIRSLPVDKLQEATEYKNADSLSDLLQGLINDCASLKELFRKDDDRVNLEYKKPVASFANPEEAAKIVESALTTVGTLAGQLTDEEWKAETKVFKGEKFWIEARGMVAWHHFFNMIQERGQLASEISPGTEIPSST